MEVIGRRTEGGRRWRRGLAGILILGGVVVESPWRHGGKAYIPPSAPQPCQALANPATRAQFARTLPAHMPAPPYITSPLRWEKSPIPPSLSRSFHTQQSCPGFNLVRPPLPSIVRFRINLSVLPFSGRFPSPVFGPSPFLKLASRRLSLHRYHSHEVLALPRCSLRSPPRLRAGFAPGM